MADLSVKISADVTQLTAQLAIAKASLSEYSSELRKLAQASREAGADETLRGQLTQAAEKAAQAKAQVAALNAEMKGATGSMGAAAQAGAAVASSFGGIGTKILALLGAGLGIEKITGAVAALGRLGEENLKVSATLGLTIEQVSKFSNLMQSVGADAEGAVRPLERLGAAMGTALTNPASEQAKAFQALGISMQTVASNANNTQGMLEVLRDAWSRLSDGMAKTNDFRILLGRGFDQLVPYLRMTGEEVEQLNSRLQATGANIDQGLNDKLVKTGENLNFDKLAIQGLKESLYSQLSPAIDGAAHSMEGLIEQLSSGVRAANGFNSAGGALLATVQGVVRGFAAAKLLAQELANALNALVATLSVSSAALAEVKNDVAQLNFSSATEAIKRAVTENEGIWRHFNDVAKGAVTEYHATLDLLYNGTGKGGGPFAGAPTSPKPQAGTVGSGNTDPSELSKFREQLADMEAAWTGTHRAMLAAAVQMWQGELASGKLTAKELVAAKREESLAEIALKKEDLAESQAIEKNNTQTAIELQKLKLSGLKQELEAEVAEHKITAQQKDAILQQLTTSAYQEDLKRLQQELATQTNLPVAYNATYDKILVLKQSFVQAMSQLDHQLAQDNLKTAQEYSKAWEETFQPLEQMFRQDIDIMLQGGKDMTQKLEQAFGKMLASFITDIGVMTAKWLAFKALQASGAPQMAEAVNPFGAGASGLSKLVGSAFGLNTTGPQAANTAALTALTGSINALHVTMGGNAAQTTANTASTSLNTDATSTNSGGIFSWIEAQVENLAAFLGLNTTTLANTVATVSNTGAELVSDAKSLIPFEVGAWNIPKMTPALLHAGEMVVPAQPAAQLRALVGATGGFGGIKLNASAVGSITPLLGEQGPGGSSTAASLAAASGLSGLRLPQLPQPSLTINAPAQAMAGAASSAPDVHFNINAIDTQTGIQFIRQHGEEISRNVSRAWARNPTQRPNY